MICSKEDFITETQTINLRPITETKTINDVNLRYCVSHTLLCQSYVIVVKASKIDVNIPKRVSSRSV